MTETEKLLLDTKLLTVELRVKQLRGLSSGLKTHAADGLRELGKLLGDTATEIEDLVAENYRLQMEKAALPKAPLHAKGLS